MAKKRKAGEYRLSNPVLGIIGVVVIIALTIASFSTDAFPVIGKGPKYTAYFSEAAGLQADDEVRIAGVKVGKVSDVSLDGDRVKIQFRAKDAWLGDDTRASIQIKSVLGQKFLALDPAGAHDLEHGAEIPLDRTTAPYDVVTAFSTAAETLQAVDTDKLAGSLDTLSATMQGDPKDFRGAVDGLSRLSRTISSRDTELRTLLEATKTSSKILADRNDDFRRLIIGAGQLLGELNTRADSIKLILASSRGLSTELRTLVAENEERFGPTLDKLDQTLGILTNHEADLRKSIHNLGPFYRLYANILGTGRWFDTIVSNLLPPGVPIFPGQRGPARTEGVR